LNYSDIRKQLKKGELAIEALEKMDYSFVDNQREHPHWKAPVNPIDPIVAAIQKMIADKVDEDIKARIKDDPRGPNWHLVAPMVGKNFRVRPECIPLNHQLRKYSATHHFDGRSFHAIEIRYHRSNEYTGYAVLFKFAVHAFNPEVVWLPLSAVAFSN
jgi:hypothetical protein